MGLSHGYGKIPERSYSIETIQKAYDFGCTLFDTAEVYGDVLYHTGHNEEIVGEAIKDFREDIILATKLHITPDEYIGRSTLYDAMLDHLKSSMDRLQRDHIDLYYLHRVNEDIAVEEVDEVMGRFIEEGYIKEWGISQVDTETLDKVNKITHHFCSKPVQHA